MRNFVQSIFPFMNPGLNTLTVYSSRYTFHNIHSTLYAIPAPVLNRLYFILYILCTILNTLYSTHCILQTTLYTPNCILYTLCNARYTPYSTVCTLLFKPPTLFPILYQSGPILCSLFPIQYQARRSPLRCAPESHCDCTFDVIP